MKKINEELKSCIKCIVNQKDSSMFCCLSTLDYIHASRIRKMHKKYNNRLNKKIKNWKLK